MFLQNSSSSNCVSQDLQQLETEDDEIDRGKQEEYLQVIFVGD